MATKLFKKSTINLLFKSSKSVYPRVGNYAPAIAPKSNLTFTTQKSHFTSNSNNLLPISSASILLESLMSQLSQNPKLVTDLLDLWVTLANFNFAVAGTTTLVSVFWEKNKEKEKEQEVPSSEQNLETISEQSWKLMKMEAFIKSFERREVVDSLLYPAFDFVVFYMALVHPELQKGCLLMMFGRTFVKGIDVWGTEEKRTPVAIEVVVEALSKLFEHEEGPFDLSNGFKSTFAEGIAAHVQFLNHGLAKKPKVRIIGFELLVIVEGETGSREFKTTIPKLCKYDCSVARAARTQSGDLHVWIPFLEGKAGEEYEFVFDVCVHDL